MLCALFSEIPKGARDQLVGGIDWIKQTGKGWPNTLIASAGAKMFRSLIGSVMKMPTKQCVTFFARSCGQASCWDSLVVEGAEQLPKHRDSIERRRFVVAAENFEANAPTALEVIIAVVGQAMLAGYFPVPQVGLVQPEAQRVGRYDLLVASRHEVVIGDRSHGLSSIFKYLPWIMRKGETVEKAGEILDVVFEAWAMSEQLALLIRQTREDAEDVRREIQQLYHDLAHGVRHWVPPDGQVKLQVGDTLTRSGLNTVELHPGPVPSMRLRINYLTHGYRDQKWTALDDDGIMDLVPANEEKEDRQILYLALNLQVVRWLHYFATHGPATTSEDEGGAGVAKKRKKKIAGVRLATCSNGLPPGWQWPGYMKTKGKMTEDYAKVRCEARGMPLPAKDSHLTYREYPAGKRGKPLEAVDLVKIDVTYDLDL